MHSLSFKAAQQRSATSASLAVGRTSNTGACISYPKCNSHTFEFTQLWLFRCCNGLNRRSRIVPSFSHLSSFLDWSNFALLSLHHSKLLIHWTLPKRPDLRALALTYWYSIRPLDCAPLQTSSCSSHCSIGSGVLKVIFGTLERFFAFSELQKELALMECSVGRSPA